MKKWICKQCGYTHYGDEAPERCSQCGASKSQFYCPRKGQWCTFGILFIVVAVLTALCFAFCSCSTAAKVDNAAVSTLDVNRYLGQWYELARFDHRFERDMTYCTATYLMQDDGTVKVINQGKKDGKWEVSEGKAKLTKDPGVLRVSFFGPFYSDYRVLMLAPDYSYALVGGGSDDYLWILSRTPQLDTVTRDRILAEARHRGYTTGKLIWVLQ